jgi:NAD(P)-dependent dehydrogenase (short-subunit alcohol dehydrogenase family)
MTNPLDFTGKQFLITGASTGIGKETAILLSNFGAKIILVSLFENELQEAISALKNEGHFYYQYDLNNVDGIEPLMKEISTTHGAFDGFIHCAGIAEVRPLKLSNYSFMQRVMNINFFSFVEISRCITKKNAFNKGMNIVGVSALGAFLGNSTKTAYCSSKAAMNSATRCMAKELSSKGIRVNTVAPGVTNTKMFDDFESMDVDSDEYRAILQRQYLGICQPVDIANSIAFLLSDMSRMITGSCITIDGGKLTS